MPIAVITGATQGIGKATAVAFLNEGFSIAVCARTATDLQQTTDVWKKEYPTAEILSMVADLSSREAVQSFAAAILKRFGSVDVLVNNAGLFFPGSLMEEPEGQLEHLMQVNVYSAYHLTRALVPAIKSSGSGHIFNLCSVASLRAYDNGGSYSITKYALQGFSDNLRHELMPYKIKVTALMPGATWSRSWSGSGVSEDRIMKAADVADMIVAAWRTSPQACVETIILRPLAGDL